MVKESDKPNYVDLRPEEADYAVELLGVYGDKVAQKNVGDRVLTICSAASLVESALPERKNSKLTDFLLTRMQSDLEAAVELDIIDRELKAKRQL